MADIDNWIVFILVYFILASVTFIPVLRDMLKRTDAEKEERKAKGLGAERGKEWEKERRRQRQRKNPFAGEEFTFERIQYMGFNEEQWMRLYLHYDRITDTLDRWKRTAKWNKSFHYYVLCWTLAISIVIPVMVGFIDISEYFAKLFLMIISLHSAVLLAFHRALKVENNYKSFRQGEAEFQDLWRRFLDMPQTFGNKNKNDPEEQICNYFTQAECIRKFVRAAETDNFPGVEDKSGATAAGRSYEKNARASGRGPALGRMPESAPPNLRDGAAPERCAADDGTTSADDAETTPDEKGRKERE